MKCTAPKYLLVTSVLPVPLVDKFEMLVVPFPDKPMLVVPFPDKPFKQSFSSKPLK